MGEETEALYLRYDHARAVFEESRRSYGSSIRRDGARIGGTLDTMAQGDHPEDHDLGNQLMLAQAEIECRPRTSVQAIYERLTYIVERARENIARRMDKKS